MFTSMNLLAAMNDSEAGVHGCARMNSANLYGGGDGGVCVRVCVCVRVRVLVCLRARAFVMFLQYTTIA